VYLGHERHRLVLVFVAVVVMTMVQLALSSISAAQAVCEPRSRTMMVLAGRGRVTSANVLQRRPSATVTGGLSSEWGLHPYLRLWRPGQHLMVSPWGAKHKPRSAFRMRSHSWGRWEGQGGGLLQLVGQRPRGAHRRRGPSTVSPSWILLVIWASGDKFVVCDGACA
jgi:hypothetical protein